MIPFNLVFNSSLPRSGSTLLQNLLAQSAQNHCTPTSDLVELVVQARNLYPTLQAFQSQGVFNVAPRIRTALRGLMTGYYADCENKTVFEKSRGWLSYIELLEEILERPVKVIVCVRDIRDIVASFERKFRTHQLTKADAPHPGYIAAQTIEGRIQQLLSGDSVVGLAVNRLRDAYDRGLADRLVIVRYDDLVDNPAETIIVVSSAVGSTPFLCDAARVEQHTHENDSVHGMRLHDIRPVVSREGSTNWRDFLPERIGEQLHQQYPLIQQLAGVES